MQKGEFISSCNRKAQELASGIAGSRGPQRCHQHPVSSSVLSSTCPWAAFLLRQCLHKAQVVPPHPHPQQLQAYLLPAWLPSRKSFLPQEFNPGLTHIDPSWVTCLSLGTDRWGQGTRIRPPCLHRGAELGGGPRLRPSSSSRDKSRCYSPRKAVGPGATQRSPQLCKRLGTREGRGWASPTSTPGVGGRVARR